MSSRRARFAPLPLKHKCAIRRFEDGAQEQHPHGKLVGSRVSSLWGGFARADPHAVEGPVHK